MTRAHGALVAVVCGVFLSLVLSGCDGEVAEWRR